MELRRRIAALGAVLVLLHLFANAAGFGSPAQLISAFVTDPRFLAQAVSIELTGTIGAPRSTPSPLPSVPTPCPTPSPAPTVTPKVLETMIGGGIQVDNQTDYTIDTAQLLLDGPSQQLAKGHPQILVTHTHSSEAYTMDDFTRYEPSDSSRTQDPHFNIIRVGDALTQALEEYGLEVIHDREIYDYPSYAGSYTRCGDAISRYLEEYPSIAIVFDVHRDAIGSGEVVYKTVAENEDIPCAQTMLVAGSNASGLEHPDWEENLKLAVYLQAAVHGMHPTLQRPVKLVRERYNQQLTTGSLILEVGSNGNTLQEALNAIQLFAEAAGPALAKLVTDA